MRSRIFILPVCHTSLRWSPGAPSISRRARKAAGSSSRITTSATCTRRGARALARAPIPTAPPAWMSTTWTAGSSPRASSKRVTTAGWPGFHPTRAIATRW